MANAWIMKRVTPSLRDARKFHMRLPTGSPDDQLGAHNGGYTRAGADRGLVTECHPVLGRVGAAVAVSR
jgi:hypothetical protein